MDIFVPESEEQLLELQFSDEYTTDLQADDVIRILQLPEEIQLALPHLRSRAEIDAHKLLTKYTHGRSRRDSHDPDQAEVALADELSQDCCFLDFSDYEKLHHNGGNTETVSITAGSSFRLASQSSSGVSVQH